MKSQLYKNRDWLINQYTVRKNSANNIATTCGVRCPTIYYWLNKYEIEIRKRGFCNKGRYISVGPFSNKEWLYGEYWIKHKSAKQIAEENGVSRSLIIDWLHRHEINNRNSPEARALLANSVDLTGQILEHIEGELMGDGGLERTSACCARYVHGTNKLNYLTWRAETFTESGIEQSGKILMYEYPRKNPADGNRKIYLYKTKAYKEFAELYDKWYPGGKKAPPKDLVITPTVLLFWYIGDGCLVNRRAITLCTLAFSRNDIDLLVEKLCDLGIGAKQMGDKNVIYVGTKSVDAFLSYIGNAPKRIEEDYGYKWAVR